MKRSGQDNLFTRIRTDRLLLFFLTEGLLFQFAGSLKGFGTNLFATNLGATDTELGLIQTVGNLFTLAFLIPIGLIADRQRLTARVTGALAGLSGLTFLFQALVPRMGALRIPMFFLSVGLTSAMFNSYSSQWQVMFGDMVTPDRRDMIYARRTQCMSVLGVLIPLACGVFMVKNGSPETNLKVLCRFDLAAGILLMVLCVRLLRDRTVRLTAAPVREKVTLAGLGRTIRDAAADRRFRIFVICALILYTSWQVDWTVWYIGQTQYCGMTSAHMSYYTAITCLGQLISLGFLARINTKRTAHFTVCLCYGALMCSPLLMLLITSLPQGIRPGVFMPVCALENMIEMGLPMCITALLLEAVPEKHRALNISLYTVLTTLTASFFPLLGVKIYTALGASISGMHRWNLVLFVWRASALSLFVWRYFVWKRARGGAA